MNEEEQQILDRSKSEIKNEAEKIAASITRIVMLGGPYQVEHILNEFLKVNEQIKESLSTSMKVEFK